MAATRKKAAPVPDEPANDEPATQPAGATTGPVLVTVTVSAPVTVTVETVSDRERKPNGTHTVDPGVNGHFIVSEGQSIRVDPA